MFFQTIQITQQDLQRLLATDTAGFFDYARLYVDRKFYIGDTGINRKTLNDWENSGLLPYEYNEDGWRKFSFFEWVWLECINEFRQLGVSIEKIKTVKSIFFDFDPEELFAHFKTAISKYDGTIADKQMILEAYSHPELTKEIRHQAIKEMQMSPLLLFVMAVVITGQNICIVYNNSNYCSLFVLGATDNNIRENNEEVFPYLMNDSFLIVNLKKVVNNLLQKPDAKHNDDFILDFLSPKEKKIINEIRKRNAKEITIRFNKEDEPTHIKVNRNRISKDTINKVARYLKKGNYQTIEFTTRDGELIKYEEQDMIKL